MINEIIDIDKVRKRENVPLKLELSKLHMNLFCMSIFEFYSKIEFDI